MITNLKRMRALLVLIAAIVLSFLAVSVVLAITRQEVRDRTQAWVNAQVPYNQGAYPDGFRADCSGFVSYGWNLRDNAGNTRSLTTWTLPNVSYRISKDELQTGDILLNTSSHVLFFDQWANSQHTEYWAYEMTPPRAVYKKIPYPYWSGYGTFEPYRYTGLASVDTDDNRTMSYGQTLNGTVNPANDRDTYYFSGSTGNSVTIRMNKANSSLDSYVELWKDGRLIGQNDDSGGNFNSLLVTALSESGTYRIVARGYGSSTGTYTLQLTQEAAQDSDDYRWIAYGQNLQGTISPNNDRDTYYFGGTANRVVSIRMNKIDSGLDSYLELWSPNGSLVTVNDDGGGDYNSWLVATLPSNGTYRIVARSWNFSSSGRYTLSVGQVTASNLALGKGTTASSVEFSGVEPNKAFDGSMSTRWSSRFVDPGWIYVDLGQDYTFDQVVLRWETAYARRYGIYVWRGSYWQNLYWTDTGDGGVDTITFGSTTGRWILMYGIQRGTPWGYSLWEFEVYNTAATVIPIVPPEDPGKGDPGQPEEPLPPTTLGKDVEALSVGSGEDGQENMPLPATPPGEPPLMDITTTYSPPTANIDVITPTVGYQGIHSIYFAGSGVDNDEGGQSIIAYAWSSSLDGPIGVGYSPSFTWPADAFSVGTHIITLTVQDNEGIWSQPVTATLTINPSYQLFLPLIFR